jgi:hypothetical protein
MGPRVYARGVPRVLGGRLVLGGGVKMRFQPPAGCPFLPSGFSVSLGCQEEGRRGAGGSADLWRPARGPEFSEGGRQEENMSPNRSEPSNAAWGRRIEYY